MYRELKLASLIVPRALACDFITLSSRANSLRYNILALFSVFTNDLQNNLAKFLTFVWGFRFDFFTDFYG
jgi:hypothetical protein